MKKIYEKPVMLAERFVPNHYVAACPDPDTYVTYKFDCNGGVGQTHYNVWLDDNPQDNQLTGEWREQVTIFGSQWTWGYNDYGDRDTWLTSGKYFHNCTQGHHEVTVPKGTSIDNIFPYGFIQVKNDRNGTVIPVRLWRGDGDIHATRTLNSSEFTPVKNLS